MLLRKDISHLLEVRQWKSTNISKSSEWM